MIVGSSSSGKSMLWKLLQQTLQRFGGEEELGHGRIEVQHVCL
jgi:ABC-type multidrug transport system fused ATPase/permease subunit